jgi:pimeloyl-ACP methyl ester carboxylesterase
VRARRPQVTVVAVALIALTGATTLPAVAQDTAAFHELATEVAGVYALEADRHLVIVPHSSLRLLSLFDLETGLARPLEPVIGTTGDDDGAPPDSYVYGPNVTAVAPVEGRITFMRDQEGAADRLLWQPASGGDEGRIAHRVPLLRESVRFANGHEAELAGWLITPPSEGPHPVAVILQPGANDRFEMWRTAMALAVEGLGVLVFDRRDAGESSGEALPSHYWSAAQVLAGDGEAAVRFARSHPRVDSARVGVVGWSGGGWLGALVARRGPELAFYVNIAGNANPGWQQNRWNRLSTLRWEGFDAAAVDEAAAFLDVHYFALMHGETTWAEYEAAVRELEGRPWFDWMRKNFGLWDSEAEARDYAELERDNVPEEDFARVAAPTLGLFFEHDESSPPETPTIFLRGRARGPNPDVTVRIFANTTHEAFVVEEFPTAAGQSRIERLEPGLFRALRRWVGEVVGDRVRAAQEPRPH